MSRFSTNVKALSSVGVGTSLSNPIDVSMRTLISIQFTAAAITSGNGVFTVLVSNDGVNYVAYNRLTSNATNTNAQNDTRVASVTLNAAGSSMVFFPLGDYFASIKVQVVGTTDGTYSATVQAVD
jgi:hypothetical protein